MTNKSSPHPHAVFPQNIYLTPTARYFLSGFLAKLLYIFIISPIHATWVAHLIFGLITLILFGEEDYDSSTQSFAPATTTAAAAAATTTTTTTTTTTSL
jgi:hypothetical protein